MEIDSKTEGSVGAGLFKNVLLVDYENVGKVDLGAIPADVQVPFFFGASQKSVPTDFMRAALKLGQRFIPIDIEGHGANALDFHIAFYLGEYLALDPHTNCIILSKDKGFDPLVKHLQGRRFKVRRTATISEAFPADKVARQAAAAMPAASEVKDAEPALLVSILHWLSVIQARTRPRKRKSLAAHLHSHFGKKIPQLELERLIDVMIAQKKLSDVNGTLAYHLDTPAE